MKLGRIAAREHIPDDVAHAKAPGGLTRRPHIGAVFAHRLCNKKKQPHEQREQNEGRLAALILAPRGVPPQRRTHWGPQMWTPFLRHCMTCVSCEATALWTWSNFLDSTTAPGVHNVHINFDETSVCLYQECKSGHMVAAAIARRRRGNALTRDVKRGETRTNLTHVAFICDDPQIQVLLPQIIILAERTLSAQSVAEIARTLPPPCVLLRCKNAWVSEDTMLHIAAELGGRLAPFAATHAFTLFADS